MSVLGAIRCGLPSLDCRGLGLDCILCSSPYLLLDERKPVL